MELNITIKKKPQQMEGNMIHDYVPFKNLISSDGDIQSFRTNKLSFSLDKPVDINIQPSFDGSVNLITNDDYDIPKLINSRFSTAEDNTFIIPDHFGNKDTNLYENDNIKLETSLYKTVSRIVKLEFLGLDEGNLKCGTYHFYFKLCDNDGNSSDIISESGMVVCHKGKINNPFSISMGMEDESSDKSVTFKLTNLDDAYDFVKVYYTRTTSGKSQVDVTHAKEIDYKFPIESGIIKITGSEPELDSTIDIINFKYELASKVKSQTICQNKLFFGNIWKPKIPYEELKNLSLKIIPTIETENKFLDVNHFYTDNSYTNYSNGYYNALNNYYKVGYFPEEFYRLGVVYIMSDFSLSPVFNVRGINYLKESVDVVDADTIVYDDNGYISGTNNTHNAYGVINTGINNTILEKRTPLYINLKLRESSLNDNEKELLGLIGDNKSIAGYFFVRQNRIPTILGQGMAIGKTKDNYGNLPCLKRGKYFSESFLKTISIREKAGYNMRTSAVNLLSRSYVNINNDGNVQNKALLIPGAELNEEQYSNLFTSSDFKLTSYANAGITKKLNNGFYQQYYTSKHPIMATDTLKANTIYDTKLTQVSPNTPLTTNGVDYFSSKAGDKFQLNQLTSVNYDWEKYGEDIDVSPSVNVFSHGAVAPIVKNLSQDKYIRGIFGGYVGSSNRNLEYADIVNIRPEDFDYNNSYYEECELSRRFDNSIYHPITDRTEIKNITSNNKCFRGDCFIVTHTHRMLSNYIDPDTPTNNDIVQPYAWNNNFKVMTKSNGNGLYINEVVPLFKARNPERDPLTKWLSAIGKLIAKSPIIGLGFDFDSMKDEPGIVWWDAYGHPNVEIILPGNSKYGNPSGTGEMFGIPGHWQEYGLDKINRSDLNAVGLGHWITYSVLSNYNTCFRSEDMYNTQEENLLHQRRSFYPLTKMSINNKTQDSTYMNGCINKTLSDRNYHIMPDVPYIKQQFDNRIIYSESSPTNAFKNGFRVFPLSQYQDYPKTYGAIVKLVEFQGNIISVMEHGILLIPINERVQAANGQGGSVFINTNKVLPINPRVISDTYGSIFEDSIIKTPAGIYGLDTVAKKIWYFDGQSLKILSDMKIERFLNTNIDISETDKFPKFGKLNIKSHYNNFKKDVIFTYNNVKSHLDGNTEVFDEETKWSVCYNEYLQTFTTFYSWVPSHMVNIDTLSFSLDYDKTKEAIFGLTMNDIKNQKLLSTINYNHTLSKNWSNLYGKNIGDVILHNMDGITLSSNSDFVIDGTDLKLAKQISGSYDLILNKISDDGIKDNDSQIILHFINSEYSNSYYLWKHGQSGNFKTDLIKPTNWYGIDRKFEFEFIVAKDAMTQKVFDNLMMISNNVKPNEIEFDVVGDSYEFAKYKDIIISINNDVDDTYNSTFGITKLKYLENKYKEYLLANPKIKKLPFLPRVRKMKDFSTDYNGYEISTSSVWLVHDELLNESRIRSNQHINNISDSKYNIINSNAQYIEDIWKFEITPINFKYLYIKSGELKYSKYMQAKIRDKYCRIRVNYKGNDLSIIQAINTLYEISYV